MSNAAPQTYTLSQLATTLGCKRQAMARSLEKVPPSGQRIIAGNVANAWTISALPLRLQTELNDRAERRGYRNAQAMLNGGALPLAAEFEEKVRACPISQIRPEFISRAIALRDALAKPLAQQHEITSTELTALGVAEYSRVFGYSISTKHWNRLFDRTVQRDGNTAKWTRLELYLDDAAFIRPLAAVVKIAKHYDHGVLGEVLANVENKQQPTTEDRAWIFDASFRHYESLCAEKRATERAEIKASLVAHLFCVLPGLAKTVKALRRNFDRKLNEWIAGERTSDVLRDERRLKSGNFRTPDFSEDIKKIRDAAYNLHGNESLAYRRLRKCGELSEEFVNYYTFNIRKRKSAVPASVRSAITPQIEAAIDQYQGERQARLSGPSIPRDWSDTLPGDYLSGDDTTLNHPFSTPNEEGGHDLVMRGEFLLLNDLRTGFPLDHQLIAGPYNGRHPLSGMIRINDSVGLPRKGGYWEKGVWESRWIPGVAKKHSVHWRETEMRLRDAGFDMGPLAEFERRHAISPRSKPIEGAFRIIQAMMVDQPAYLGRNERSANFKPLQDFIGRCRRGTEDPRNEGIMPMEHWIKRITEILEEYADEPQNGKMLPGVSPREMWEDGLAKHPLKQLAPAQRIGLCTNRKIIRRISNNGIVLREVPQFVYANDELRQWQMKGRAIVAFYNVDVPELLTVSNINLTEFFTIKGVGLRAMTATSDELREATQQIRGFMKPARVLHAQITQRKRFTMMQDVQHDAPIKALGEFHNAEVAAHQEQKSERTRKMRKVQTAAAVAGASVGAHVRNPDRVLQGIEWEQEIRARLAAKEVEDEK